MTMKIKVHEKNIDKRVTSELQNAFKSFKELVKSKGYSLVLVDGAISDQIILCAGVPGKSISEVGCAIGIDLPYANGMDDANWRE